MSYSNYEHIALGFPDTLNEVFKKEYGMYPLELRKNDSGKFLDTMQTFLEDHAGVHLVQCLIKLFPPLSSVPHPANLPPESSVQGRNYLDLMTSAYIDKLELEIAALQKRIAELELPVNADQTGSNPVKPRNSEEKERWISIHKKLFLSGTDPNRYQRLTEEEKQAVYSGISLTGSERAVFDFRCAGTRYKDVAATLGISESSVKRLADKVSGEIQTYTQKMVGL